MLKKWKLYLTQQDETNMSQKSNAT